MTKGDQKQSILAVVNGSKGWRKVGATVTEMPSTWAEGVLRNIRAEGIRLICSLDDPNCESSLIEAGKVGDRPTHTVKVHSEGARYDKSYISIRRQVLC